MKQAFLWVLISALLAGCTVHVIGPKNALIPEGEPVVVTLAGGDQKEGELLEVTDTGLILQEHDGLSAVNYQEMRQVLLSRYSLSLSGDWQNKLPLYSRYPQGLTDGQRRQLLAEAGQNDFLRSYEKAKGQPSK